MLLLIKMVIMMKMFDVLRLVWLRIKLSVMIKVIRFVVIRVWWLSVSEIRLMVSSMKSRVRFCVVLLVLLVELVKILELVIMVLMLMIICGVVVRCS